MSTGYRPATAPPGHVPPATEADPRRWRMLGFVALAQFMVLLDTTVVNLALPQIQSDFHAGTTGAQWVLTGYVLCFGGLMLLGGRLADRWGRRVTFLSGLLLFTAASLLCGLCPGTGWLIAARALQGCGAALLSPAAMSLVTTSFPAGRERTTALGVWAALAGLGGTLGVVLGGVITDSLDWRWIFYVNLPVGVIAGVGVLLFTDRAPLRRSGKAGHGRPDVSGALTATTGLACLVYAIVNIEDRGLGSPWVTVPGAAAALLLAGFVLVERRTPDPLVPLDMFTSRSLAAAGVGRLLTSAVQAAVLFLLSFYLQRTLGYSTLRAGFAFLPVGLAAVAVTGPITRFLHRAGPRPVYLLGAAGSLLALGWLTQLPRHGDYLGHLLVPLLLTGICLQMCTIPVNVHGISEVPEHRQGVASGLLTAAFQVGACLGLAIVATGLASRTEEALASGGSPQTAWWEGLHTGFTLALVFAALNLLNALFGFTRSPAPSRSE